MIFIFPSLFFRRYFSLSVKDFFIAVSPFGFHADTSFHIFSNNAGYPGLSRFSRGEEALRSMSIIDFTVPGRLDNTITLFDRAIASEMS